MYTILVLVSLAAAVSCHHAIPDPFGDDSVGQARIKRLGELDDSISRLVARAMNLKSALTQRLKNKEEADRKAKNILLRLDRMNVDDGVQRCADTDKDFRCRRSSKCIKNILVCDGKKDCDDGTDEDKDLCNLPVKEGSIWLGKVLFYSCTEMNLESIHLKWVQKLQGVIPSNLQVIGISRLTYTIGKEAEQYIALKWMSTYSFAKQTATRLGFFRGMHHYFINTFYPDEGIFYFTIHSVRNDRPCGKSVFRPIDIW